jgi:multiple sugar transport system ATP-binding protein
LRAEIKQLHQRTQTTTVYVTHDQVEAMTLGDRIAVMKDGTVQQFGTPSDIYARPATRFVAEFIGSPAMNLLSVERQAHGVGVQGVSMPVGPVHQAALLAHGGTSWVYGLRPESVAFANEGLPGELTMIEPTGPETYVAVNTTVGQFTVRMPGMLKAQIGDRVHLQWSPDDVHLFDRESGLRLG